MISDMANIRCDQNQLPKKNMILRLKFWMIQKVIEHPFMDIINNISLYRHLFVIYSSSTAILCENLHQKSHSSSVAIFRFIRDVKSWK